MKARVQKTLSNKVKEDIRKEFIKLLDIYNYDAALQIIHILHFDYGWGQKRLERFCKNLIIMQKEQKERYELEDEATPWLCERQLKQDGIDVKKLMAMDGDKNE